MRVIFFQSESNPNLLALTVDEANLPAEHAPWRPLGGTLDRASDTWSGFDPVLCAIVDRGYYMIR